MILVVFRRLLATVPLMILVSMIAFGLLFLVPGDPATTLAGENPAPGQIEEIRARLGLDDPIPIQYLQWAAGAVSGDLGDSLFSNAPVAELIAERMPATISLTITATAFGIAFGALLGITAAAYRGGVVDRCVTMVASLGVAVPSFWLGLMLIIAFALYLGWLPAVGYVPLSAGPGNWLAHLVLPAVTLGLAPAAEIARQLRGSLCDALDNDYIRTARAKGVRARPVLLKHALKNAGVTAMTVIGTQFSLLLGGSVIAEQIFGIPGIGNLAVTAVLQRDVPVIQGVVLVSAVAVLLCNLAVDMSYGYFNPKVRAA